MGKLQEVKGVLTENSKKKRFPEFRRKHYATNMKRQERNKQEDKKKENTKLVESFDEGP